jgi:hypothetical protein
VYAQPPPVQVCEFASVLVAPVPVISTPSTSMRPMPSLSITQSLPKLPVNR